MDGAKLTNVKLRGTGEAQNCLWKLKRRVNKHALLPTLPFLVFTRENNSPDTCTNKQREQNDFGFCCVKTWVFIKLS